MKTNKLYPDKSKITVAPSEDQINPLESGRLVKGINLQTAIHNLLVLGVGLSSTLMVVGLLLDVVLHRPIPTTVPPLGEAFQRLINFRPSGFLSFGLFVLIATPIVRVICSMLAFVYEGDWRYATITLAVLLIVISSIILG